MFHYIVQVIKTSSRHTLLINLQPYIMCVSKHPYSSLLSLKLKKTHDKCHIYVKNTLKISLYLFDIVYGSNIASYLEGLTYLRSNFKDFTKYSLLCSLIASIDNANVCCNLTLVHTTNSKTKTAYIKRHKCFNISNFNPSYRNT